MNSHRTYIPHRLVHPDRDDVSILYYPIRSPLTGETLHAPDTQDPDDAVWHHADRLGRLSELPWAKNHEPVGENLPRWVKKVTVTGLEEDEDESDD